MRTVTIRELHPRTGRWIREASRYGEICVTDNGRIVAKIVPASEPATLPYFARRKYLNSRTKRLIESGESGRGGIDVTQLISEDRADRV